MGYSIKEIIDIAVGIEDTGYNFYTKCSAKFKDSAISELFILLAKEELEHKKKFQAMDVDEEPAPGLFTDEYYLYLKSIGGGRIFPAVTEIDAIIESISTPLGAIQKAFNDEKNSILYYSEIKKVYAPDSGPAGLLDKIIEEERSHVMKLLEIKKELG